MPVLSKKCLFCLLAATLSVAAQQQRRIYLANDDHTDYMWTADEETYRQSMLRMLDYYLDQADRTSADKPEFQGRWHADGSFWIWTFEHSKPPADFARLVSRVRDGHISFPLNALVSTYGGTPTEAVLRGMYYAGTLERRFGLKIPMAIANEDQTLPYGLGALWAGSGAKYSWKGICGCATKITPYGKRPHDIYWWKAGDGSRILMKWNALTPGRDLLGNYLEARQTSKVIHFVETDTAFQSAYPYPVIGIFGKGGDDLETLTDEFITVAKEQSTPERKVIVSNMTDFFEDFEKTYGKTLPEFSGGFGNEWDLYTASVPEISARVRRAVEKLRAAEALASLVSLQWPELLNGRHEERNRAWMNLGLFWEHDWTADGPLTRQQRADWGRKLAAQIEAYVDSLHADAAYGLGGLIRSSQPEGRRFYVFNPLGWVRSSAVADIPYADTAAPIHVVDLTTGLEAPSQSIVSGRQRFLRILASALPSVGYKVFEIRPGMGKDFTPAATVNGGILENSQYQVTVGGNGAIRSLIGKMQNNREFVGRRGALNDLGPEEGRLAIANAGPVSVTLEATAPGPLAHTTRITLFRDSRQLEIHNEIEQNFDGTHSWNFQFNFTSPDVWHEESGAVIRAKLLTQGGHYSPTMSRLDWLTLNHFADMSGGDGTGVTLSSSDLAFMKLGDSKMVDGVARLDTGTPQIRVLAGGQVDGPNLGIHKQGGDSHFLQRFALRTHAGYSAIESMKFALEHQNPPVAGWVRQGRGPYPEKTYSLLSISNPEVLLWAVKPADDGLAKGLITRVWNLSSKPQTYAPVLATGIAGATRATHIETDIEPIPITNGTVAVTAAATQIQTLRLTPAKAQN